ncbi:MAG: M50 family metallopeptidase [Patescibacteria group bacterium]
MFTLLTFIAVLAVLVISHEFGHFIVARKNGIQVDEFGFGFPPRLIGIRRVSFGGKKKWQIIWHKRQLEEVLEHDHLGTIYSINLIPLGGFVKIKGESGFEEGANDPDSFFVKKTWQKAIVIAAGVIMNFFLAGVLLSVGYMIGMPQVGDGDAGPNSKLQVVQVMPEMPADKVGIKSGAEIYEMSAGGQILNAPNVNNFREFVNSHRNEDILVKYKFEGKNLEKTIKPEILEGTDRAGFGVVIVNVGTVRYPWYRAIVEGFKSAGQYLFMIFAGLWSLLKQLFAGQSLDGQVAGPVGVAVITGEAARMGFVYLLQLTALLSLNLAAINILPIPALDGGRLMFILIGRILRREIKPRIENFIHTVGFVLLMALVVTVTVKDLGTFGGGFIEWWKNLIRF